MLWLGENREAIKRKYPGSSVADVAKRAGEMWKTVTAEEKAVSTGCTVACKKDGFGVSREIDIDVEKFF